MKTHIKNADVPLEKLDDKLSRKIMGYDTDLMLVRVLFKKGGVGATHAHPHQQVTYVEKGKFEVTINNKTDVLVEGDAFVVPSNAPHGAVCLEDGVLIDTFSPMREDFVKK
jgi:quercetin dioxygenase-like cupin family protein